MLTGAQTAKRRKAGSRVTTAGTFAGSSQALNADKDEKRTGIGFRKKAGRCVVMFVDSYGSESLDVPMTPASEPAKNGPWLRKDACLLYEMKVKGVLYVA
jgi:hypothetical protein